MNRFFNRLLIALCMVLFFGTASATNYYTISTGDYSDVSNVWSTDGVNPCFCAPPSTLAFSSDSVFIRHDLAFNSTVNINGGAFLSIDAAASVTSPGLIRVDAGQLVNHGSLSPASLQIFNGQFTSTGSVDVTAGSFFNFNSTTDISGYMHVSVDFRVFNGSTFTLRTNSTLVVDGFFFNLGTVITEPGSCINVAGDFLSTESGNVIGDGHVSAGFNITSNGFWDSNTSWCAGVSGFGLPTPPDCINCGPLPVTLLAFDALFQPGENAVDLKWTTGSEVNNDHFTVERSTDGVHFQPLGTLASTHLNGLGSTYELRDASPGIGMNYYRLSQVDRDGSSQVLETEKVYVSGISQSSFVLFPNPSSGPVNYQLSLEEAAPMELQVLDLSGRMLVDMENAAAISHAGQLETDGLAKGIYIVRIKAGSFAETLKLTVR